MKRTHIRTLMAPLAIVAALLVAVPSAAASADRPIKEDLAGYVTGMEFAADPAGETFDGRCSVPSQWISSMAGTGVVSHLGQVAWSTEHCFQAATGTFGDAQLVITAANGDQLFGTYDGVMTGETTFAETMVVTGGTGRFTEASGTVAETGWFDLDTGYIEITGIGSILYDASHFAPNR